tara:strand:+ start:183 stop:332 length:150 start_codon:yes stop_codon:yes gene_type:complete
MKTKKTSWKELPSGVYCRVVNGKVEVLTPREFKKLHSDWWTNILKKYFI